MSELYSEKEIIAKFKEAGIKAKVEKMELEVITIADTPENIESLQMMRAVCPQFYHYHLGDKTRFYRFVSSEKIGFADLESITK